VKATGRIQDRFIYIIAFLLPLTIMGIISVACQVAPFGDGSYMIVDALHQYLPFLSEYQGKLQTGESLFYTWNGGMGMNFLSLWTYYLSSPLNLLLALGKQSWIPAIANLLLVLKLCLASVSFTYYRIHTPVYENDAKNRIYIRHRKENYSILIGALAYCFSSYMVGYSWNIMWLDPIVLFPIILYGLNRLLVKKDGRCYTLTLFLALFCNYYIAFMICIYLVLWFFAHSHGSVKRFFKNGIRFAVHSLLAGAMSAVTLIPAYLGLKNTAAVNEAPPGWSFYGSWKEMLASHMYLVEPITTQVDDGGTNLYVGIGVLYLAMLYLWDRHIPFKVRIKKLGLLLVLGLSFQVANLNYVWHGFHNQYGIPNRFAFLYLFTMIIMAMEVIGHIRHIPPVVLGFQALLLGGGAALLYLHGAENLVLPGVVITVALVFVYFVMAFVMREGWLKPGWWRYGITLIAAIEVSVSAIWGFMTVGQVNISKFYNDTQIMAHIREQYPTTGRMELAEAKVVDEVTYHRLPGVTLFGSTAQGAVTTFMGKVGIYTGANEYVYQGATPFTDSLFGIQYLLVRPGDRNQSEMNYLSTAGNVEIYENFMALPLGYCVSREKEEDIYDDGNPFHYQNEWTEEMLFHDVFLGKGEERDGSYCYELEIHRDMDLYVYFWDNDVENIRIESEEKEYLDGEYRNQCIHVGEVSEGEVIRFVLTPDEGKEVAMPDQALAAEYDASAMERFYQQAMEEAFLISEKSSGALSGIVEADGDRTLVTTIPYDKGWQVIVDGETVETDAFEGVFLSVPITEGKHNVEMAYTPPGVVVGGFVSLIAWLMFFLTHKAQKTLEHP
jgi:uncharacterized membrane protein YfhO